jgi:pimeloyl-ACP methyl ester carboxylesterase
MRRVRSYTRAGLRFDVRDEGPADGDRVVLLHGFPQTSTSWDRLAPLLHEAGLRTLAPDQRGYSPGARPGRRRDYRPAELVADVLALVERVGGPVHLVGHDWGAAVGWLLAARHPEALRTFTAVSVPHPAALARSMVGSDQAARSWYMALFQLPLLPQRLLATPRATAMLRAGGMDREMVERYRREVVAGGALPYALNWYRAMPWADPRHVGARVATPTTLVWSDGDVALGRAGVDLTRRYVDGPYRLVVLEGVSHWIPEQAPRLLADAVLDRIGGSPA